MQPDIINTQQPGIQHSEPISAASRPVSPKTSGSKVGKLLLLLLAIILIAGAGYAGYAYEHNKANKKENSDQLLINALDSKVNSRNKQVQTLAKNQTSNTAGASTYLTLAPATVESKTAECSTPITVSNDADSGPIKCSNGDLNATEWQYLYKTTNLSVMTLGYSATEQQVKNAICTDISSTRTNNDGATLPIEGTALDISTLYYGWSSTYTQINIPTLSC